MIPGGDPLSVPQSKAEDAPEESHRLSIASNSL